MATLDFYTTDELIVIAAGIDAFGSTTDFDQAVLDELYRRECERQPVLLIAGTDAVDMQAELKTEAAAVRSWIGEIVGKSGAHLLRTKSSGDIPADIRNALEIIAEKMNEQHWEYSAALRDKYATSGLFLVDDLINLYQSVKSKNDTAAEIAADRRAVRDEIDAMIAALNAPDTDEISSSDSDCCCTDSNSGILHISSNNEKCIDTFQKTKRSGGTVAQYYSSNMKAAKDLHNRLKNAPKQHRYAAMFTLNDMARDVRNDTIKPENNQLTVRNKGLTRKSITYKRADLAPVDQMISTVGTAAIAQRFDSFAPQQGTRFARRTRLITKKGRGAWNRKLRKANRMNNDFANLDVIKRQSGFGGDRSRAMAGIFRMKADGELGKYGSVNKIVIPQTIKFKTKKLPNGKKRKGGTIQMGLYQVYATKSAQKHKNRGTNHSYGQLSAIQMVPKKRRELQPKRNTFFERTAHRYLRTSRGETHYIRNMRKQLKFIR